VPEKKYVGNVIMLKQFEIIDSTYPIDLLLPFCNHAIDDTRPGAVNMTPVDWENNTSSFLHALYIQKRYDGDAAGYVLYRKEGKILCGGGFHGSSIDPHMTNLSSRSYTIPGIQLPRVHGDIHTLCIDISREHGRYGSFDCVNEYNHRFIDGYLKINDPKSYPKYHFKDGKHYGKPNFRIHPSEPAGPLVINETKQWIIYQLWNEVHRESFLQTLESIRWKD
jgi:hypothetical protein